MLPTIPQITIPLRGHDNIILEPMRMVKLKAFSDAVEPVITQVFTLLEDEQNSKQNIVQMITQHYDYLVGIVCVACTGVNKEKIDDMLPDDFVNLVGGVIEVNADFFVQNLLPMILGRVESLKSKIPQNLRQSKLGQTATSHLSPTATA